MNATATIVPLRARPAPELESEAEPDLQHDSSTNALIRRYREMR